MAESDQPRANFKKIWLSEEEIKGKDKRITGCFAGLSLLLYVFACYTVIFTFNLYAFSEFKRQKTSDLPTLSGDLSNQSFCTDNSSSSSKSLEQEVQKEASIWIIVAGISGGISSLFSSFIIHPAIEKFGRKTLFYIPIMGSLIKNVCCIFIIIYHWNVYFYVPLVLIEGLLGGSSSFVVACMSYTKSVTFSKKSSKFAFGLIDLYITVGISQGTLVAGYFIDAWGYGLPVFFSIGICILAFIIVVFLPKVPRETDDGNDVTSERKLGDVLKVNVDITTSVHRRQTLLHILCLSAFYFSTLALQGKNDIEVMYLLGLPFCWTPINISQFVPFRTMLSRIVGSIFIIFARCCVPSEISAIGGAFSMLAYHVMFGLAGNSFQLYQALFVGCLSTVQISMLKSMMRKLNPSQSRYSVLSNLVLHENISRFFGSVLCASIYYVSLGNYRQLIFFVLAGVNVITVLLYIILFIGSRHLRYQGYEKI